MAAVVVAGCTGDDGAAEPADPLGQVRAAAERTAATSSRVTLRVPGVDVSGAVDPAARALSLRMLTDGEQDGEKVEGGVVVLGDDAYLKLGSSYLPGFDPTKFFTVETAELPREGLVSVVDPTDPAGLKGLAPAFTRATRAGDTITGELDLTKAPEGTSRGLLPATKEQVDAAGDALTAIPFEATVDGEGRLSSLTLSMPAYDRVPAYENTTTYTGFGEPVEVRRPTEAELTEIPPAYRTLLD